MTAPISVNNLLNLPEELLLQILSYVPDAAIRQRVVSVCTLFRRLANSNENYQFRTLRRFGANQKPILGNWKATYNGMMAFKIADNLRKKHTKNGITDIRALERESAAMQGLPPPPPPQHHLCTIINENGQVELVSRY